MGKKFDTGQDDDTLLKYYGDMLGEAESFFHGKTSWGPLCHESHPVLELGGGKVVGASCSRPRLGYDVYVGFDYSMTFPARSFPWSKDRVEAVLFPITDQKPPSDPAEFRLMVEWLREQLKGGRTVHLGCLGGHGRTGTVLAALVSTYGEKDPIRWVREHHCKKAVESEAQVKFLVKHYGAACAEARSMSYQTSRGGSTKFGSGGGQRTLLADVKSEPGGRVFVPTKSGRSIFWRRSFDK